MGCCNAGPRGTMTNLTGVTRQLQNEKQCGRGEMERLNAALAEKEEAVVVGLQRMLLLQIRRRLDLLSPRFQLRLAHLPSRESRCAAIICRNYVSQF